MPEYRCTRPALYPEGSIGHDNYKARQGHYIEANSIEEAVKGILEDFATDSVVDVQEESESDGFGPPKRFYRQ